ncbi:PucR family transcriptional regulator [Salsipaludibacter albus]|uniref:PucR family transcriptional regulator n=1 Tax=Salsipaludibacter albus TaxID=2849650 RepID=UPI001EE49100|nr:PucR family transcriptional regulator ligand-binding domain-containing protein [Salsipaludibacter albus]
MVTVRSALRLPELQVGRPRLVAGRGGLDRAVRWVHVSELPRVGHLLHGGELVLTTGLGLGEEVELLHEWVEQLADAEASGVVLELGARFPRTPTALRTAAEAHQLPLVELHREVRFVDITLAVHSRILTRQLGELQRSEEIHRVFHQLVIEDAVPQEILDRAAAMVDRPLVLENLSHQVVAVARAGRPLERVLDGWERRSRRAASGPVATGGGKPPDTGLVVSVVDGRRGRLGNLAMVVEEEPSSLERLVLEGAADALALTRGRDDRPDALDAQAHGSLLADVVDRRWSTADDVVVRARALGVELAHRRLVGLVVRFPDDPGAPDPARRAAQLVRRAVRAAHPAALVAPIDQRQVAVLASLPTEVDPSECLGAIADAVHGRAAPSGALDALTIGAGRVAHGIVAAADSLQEASHVAEGAGPTAPPRRYHTMRDVRVRGLLHLLRDDDRVQAFVERELGPLLHHDDDRDTQLVPTLRAWLDHGCNKSATAEALFLSRPTLYGRLDQVARVLAVDLDDVESRLSLHVAVLALDAMRAGTATTTPG